MKINSYVMGEVIKEYKFMKAKQKWNKVVNNLSEEEILNFGDKGYKYDQVYNYVLSKKKGGTNEHLK